MGIFSKSTEAAQNAVTKADGVVADWERKAADARAEAARIDAESGAAILADESAAERITLNVQTLERKARAFDQAAGEARKKLHAAQKEALEIEAREEDKLAATARKDSSAHEVKVADLKRQLEELDDCEWERGHSRYRSGEISGQYLGKSGALDESAFWHETRAAAIRYFLATGTIPHDFYLLDNELGTKLNSIGRSFNQGDYVPQSLYAARDAGLSFVGA